MQVKSHTIPYRLTEAFSPMVLDYLQGGDSLENFYAFAPRREKIAELIESRRRFPCNRKLLVDCLRASYRGREVSGLVSSNIESLLSENTFTVCTAHQPALFTGHLYFIYKILHAVKAADQLNKDYPSLHFVPVYYMGSEDADLKELGSFHLNGQDYFWETGQSGAFGRMLVDEAVLKLIDVIEGQLSDQPFGKELASMLRKWYSPGVTMEEAVFSMVNDLFGKWGLLILLPDNSDIKTLFKEEMGRELEEGVSAKALKSTLDKFPDVYKPQAVGRDVNLFYLNGRRRERIEKAGDDILLIESGERKPENEWKAELEAHPERFSPNVILRPVLQEKILPNVIFIGGGSELSYWLELKEVFHVFNVHFPMILLRNSFMLADSETAGRVRSMGFTLDDLFRSYKELSDIIVRNHTLLKIELTQEKEKLNGLYREISDFAAAVDKTLSGHVSALGAQALKKIEVLEKKMMRAEKRKYGEGLDKIQKCKNRLFPGGALQERVENFMPYYASKGSSFLQDILDHSGTFEQQFCTIEFS